jgi:phage shock protein C
MEHKKLYRSRKQRLVVGVCGGLAEYFNVDATIIRLILVILLLPGGFPGLIPYIIMWVIVPEAPRENIDQNAKS